MRDSASLYGIWKQGSQDPEGLAAAEMKLLLNIKALKAAMSSLRKVTLRMFRYLSVGCKL